MWPINIGAFLDQTIGLRGGWFTTGQFCLIPHSSRTFLTLFIYINMMPNKKTSSILHQDAEDKIHYTLILLQAEELHTERERERDYRTRRQALLGACKGRIMPKHPWFLSDHIHQSTFDSFLSKQTTIERSKHIPQLWWHWTQKKMLIYIFAQMTSSTWVMNLLLQAILGWNSFM